MTVLNLKAGRWSVVIKPEAEDVTSSGIYIPEHGRDDAQPGVVVAVGAGRYTEVGVAPLEIEPGDTVLFRRYSGEPWQHDGQDLVLVNENDVLAKVENDCPYCGDPEPRGTKCLCGADEVDEPWLGEAV